MQYWKKIIKYFNILVLIGGLLIPLALFCNRFLIPDVSFDSINYHLYLGFKGVNWENNKFEFYPTGIHNFASILEIPGYVLMKLFGYRVGSIGGLIFLYLSIFVVYKIFKLYNLKFKLLDKWWSGLLFVSCFLSFESFLQIATYYADIEVMFLMLLSIYFLFKYEKNSKLIDLVISAFVTSVFVLGKMTSWYFLFPYFGYLLFILLIDKKFNLKTKLFRFLLAGSISVLLLIPLLYQNFILTKNPVFPFYNGIFKSEFFVPVSFTQVIFGGRNLFEKFFWGIVSIKFPVRLGEVHDLFTDYKINIYFITSVLVLLWSIYKKKFKLLKFTLFYLGLFLSWSIFFGYLRYGLVLEVLGGLLILIWFYEYVGVKKYFILIPLIILMFIQGKRVINMSAAYDLSWRPSYYYNKSSYLSEYKNLFTNIIDNNELDKLSADIYLNCSSPGMTFYVLSSFSKLPVVNVDNRASRDITSNVLYKNEQNRRLVELLGNKKSVSFVTIVGSFGLTNEITNCLDNLKNNNYMVLKQLQIDNFLGYSGQKLTVLSGEILH